MATSLGQQHDPRIRNAVAAAWVAVLLAAILAYWPGLDGPFMLDDFGAVKQMGDYGGVEDWETFKRYVFGGSSGPTGRPIALLSFLIDANSWPAESWPFKRTNLVLHLINGILLGVLVLRVLECLKVRHRDARWIALVSAAIWLLHPFLVSTTLYIVQRMAQLSTMAIFAGLILYLHGRSMLGVNALRAYVTMSAALGAFVVLGMLCKENAILLPTLAGVLEITVIASQRQRLPALNRYWAAVFLVFPTLVIAVYLGSKPFQPDFFEILPPRDFSVYERFLTQSRVLIEYLQHLYLPKLYTTGVFQDHFIKSTGLFAPVSTALCFVVHAALIAIAVAKRRQWPLFALAVLFFYASHSLESTVLNLEQYFEHRNYVAAAFLFLPLVEILNRKANPRVFGLVSLAVILLVASFTRYSATVWSSLPSLVETSVLKAPTSARAQSQYAKLLFSFERHDEAIETIDRAIATIPRDDPLLLTNRLYFLCHTDTLEVSDFEDVAEILAQMHFDSRALKAYNTFAKEVVIGSCPNIRLEWLETMFTRMLEVPANGDPGSREYSHIQFLIGYTRTYSGKGRAALAAFEKSLDSRPGPSHAMAMASLMASSNYNREALVLSERAMAQLRKDMAQDVRLLHKVSESDIREFQRAVRADMAALQADDRTDRDD